jgi:hypothetical protein
MTTLILHTDAYLFIPVTTNLPEHSCESFKAYYHFYDLKAIEGIDRGISPLPVFWVMMVQNDLTRYPHQGFIDNL